MAYNPNNELSSARYRKRNYEHHRLIQRNSEAYCRFGLTLEQAQELRQRQCEICGDLAKKMCIDHKIKGTFRGVLCQQCNTRLGWFEKRQNTILEYLTKEKVAYARCE